VPANNAAKTAPTKPPLKRSALEVAEVVGALGVPVLLPPPAPVPASGAGVVVLSLPAAAAVAVPPVLLPLVCVAAAPVLVLLELELRRELDLELELELELELAPELMEVPAALQASLKAAISLSTRPWVTPRAPWATAHSRQARNAVARVLVHRHVTLSLAHAAV
jgi:hypothetical protein